MCRVTPRQVLMPVNTTLSPTSCLRSAELTPSQAITTSAATGGSARPAVVSLNMQPRAALVLLDAGAEMVGDDAIRPEPLLHGAIEREMQRPRWMPTSGILIAGVLAARLLVDELAEAVEEAALGVLDAGAQQLVAEAERGELAHRMRQQRDADAELLHFRRRLVDAAGNPARVQVRARAKARKSRRRRSRWSCCLPFPRPAPRGEGDERAIARSAGEGQFARALIRLALRARHLLPLAGEAKACARPARQLDPSRRRRTLQSWTRLGGRQSWQTAISSSGPSRPRA